MTPKKYTKNPITIEAMQLTSDFPEDLIIWMGDSYLSHGHKDDETILLTCKTNHGQATAYRGDWIIKTAAGEFYPCRNDEFVKNYHEAA